MGERPVCPPLSPLSYHSRSGWFVGDEARQILQCGNDLGFACLGPLKVIHSRGTSLMSRPVLRGNGDTPCTRVCFMEDWLPKSESPFRLVHLLITQRTLRYLFVRNKKIARFLATRLPFIDAHDPLFDKSPHSVLVRPFTVTVVFLERDNSSFADELFRLSLSRFGDRAY